ncbi:SAM-dependent methyltransferase [Amycolatopsis bartoniae]|uniref:Methyltransferase n=1 Tax=Amycolatopsis bartoniae TaxID=941986 RepID=A0A8H9IX42_9PSEU|nr:class I SAM-dependent methyltransferase [Amycolatopsis bartoniae]MBB2933505.1 SAM-dependent methyltransferase [Amycolatopsis bartoniae]TVT07605.1 class I SAM-dependent methyltransferase [Amycolatopsis bartoniae]GHF59962.1 methyltransferase [Amycolatopsis bartoniae]
MTTEWLDDIRKSYDTVAAPYADQVGKLFAAAPHQHAAMAAFADLVRTAGAGPVADIGCGPGHVTAHLRELGLDAFGLDLSPAMIDLARRDHPGSRFLVGSMTALPLADDAVAGLLAWWSLIHLPDDVVPAVLAGFRRVLRAGGPLLLGFHVGDEAVPKTKGYGGHPMHVHVHRRRPERMGSWLREAGFTVEVQTIVRPEDEVPSAILFAR